MRTPSKNPPKPIPNNTEPAKEKKAREKSKRENGYFPYFKRLRF